MKKLDDILNRCEAATQGPWITNEPACFNTYPGVYLIIGNRPNTDDEKIVINDDEAKKEDLEFAAHARTDLPLVVKALQKAVEILERTARHGPLQGEKQDGACGFCDMGGAGYASRGDGFHDDECATKDAQIFLAEIQTLLGDEK